MKNINNILNMRNTINPAGPEWAWNQRKVIMSDEDEEEFATHFLWVILDKSGSMTRNASSVYEQMQGTFAGLAKANENSVDMRVRMKLALFNGDITDFNDVHLDPQQLADTFTPDDYKCTGSTNAGAVFRYLDRELSRNSPAVRSLKKNSPGMTVVIVSDCEVNDPVALRQEARQILESNRFYKDYCRVLVVFLGDEKHKATAVAMADGIEQNVVALDDDLVSLLAPVIINSTVTFTDGTHINSTGERDMTKLAEDAKKRDREGSTSAGEMSDEQLRDELLRLMGEAS